MSEKAEASDRDPALKRRALSILERNIESFPTFALSGRGGDTMEFSAGDIQWKVENRPGPGARDAYVALCYLFNEERRPESRRVYSTLPQLARVMGKGKGGPNWALLARHVEELKDVKITAVGAFKKGGTRVSRMSFNLVDKVLITSPAGGDSEKTTIVVTFSEDIAGSINLGYSPRRKHCSFSGMLRRRQDCVDF